MSITVGYILVFRHQVVLGDAVSRVMNAYYVFFRGYIHMGAIGFIWNPFPSVLEMPIAAFHSIWPSLVTLGFASNIASSLFSIVSMYYMHRILFRFGFNRMWRLIWCLLFAFNPMILYYNGNGMSDGMLLGCLLAALSGILAYMEERRLEALAVGALWLAVAFMFRYEAIPFFLFTAGAIALALWRLRQDRKETEAMLVLYAMPMVYAVIAWMFLNWLIMKNPLYFLISPYGNASQIGTGSYATIALSAANHHIFKSIELALQFSLLFFPSILSMAWGAIQQFRYRPDPRWIVLLSAVLSMPLFQAVMMYLNATAGWSRFFIYYIPFGVCMLALIPSSIHRNAVKQCVLFFLTLLFVFGDIGTFHAMQSPLLGNGDYEVIDALKSNTPYETFTEADTISQYINQHNMVVLMDSFDTSAIIARLTPAKCVITSDIYFKSYLANPRGKVDAILVPKPVGISKLDAINQAYPTLWAGKVAWARLITTFSGPSEYRLYLVTSSAP